MRSSASSTSPTPRSPLSRQIEKKKAVLRGRTQINLFFEVLDADPVVLRDCRQTPRRRRHEHGGRRLVGEEGRNADRYGDDAERHAAGHPGRAPSRRRRGRAARQEGDLLGDQCRRRRPRAPDPGPPRRAHHPPPQGRHRQADGGASAATSPTAASPAPTSSSSTRSAPACASSARRRSCPPGSSGWGWRSSPTCARASPAPTSS